MSFDRSTTHALAFSFLVLAFVAIASRVAMGTVHALALPSNAAVAGLVLVVALAVPASLARLLVVRRWPRERPSLHAYVATVVAYDGDAPSRAAARRWTPIVGVGIGVGVLAMAFGISIVAFTEASATSAPDHASPLAIASYPIAIVCVLVAATAQERAFRGLLLPALVAWIGPRLGVLLHAIVWAGCWGIVSHELGLDAGALAMTFALLGFALGQLRLASEGFVPALALHATVLIGAAVPVIVAGPEAPLAAVLGPAGWIPLALAALALRPRSSSLPAARAREGARATVRRGVPAREL